MLHQYAMGHDGLVSQLLIVIQIKFQSLDTVIISYQSVVKIAHYSYVQVIILKAIVHFKQDFCMYKNYFDKIYVCFKIDVLICLKHGLLNYIKRISLYISLIPRLQLLIHYESNENTGVNKKSFTNKALYPRRKVYFLICPTILNNI